jgi:predicted negative regulator of RcsB-dependent stress response
VSEHLTRKELLRTDQFTQTIEHAADYFGMHRKQAAQVVAGVAVAAVAAVGIYLWLDHAASIRAAKLSEAMQTASAQIGPALQGSLSFPTQDAKDAAEIKAFSAIAAQYGSTKEGAIAEYSLAGLASASGHNDEARKRYEKVADSGNKDYASLAKLALAQLDFGEGKTAESEKILRDLMANPTAVVSKEQATITLVHQIAKTRPAEARAMLDPLLKEPGELGQAASAAAGEIPTK